MASNKAELLNKYINDPPKQDRSIGMLRVSEQFFIVYSATAELGLGDKV